MSNADMFSGGQDVPKSLFGYDVIDYIGQARAARSTR